MNVPLDRPLPAEVLRRVHRSLAGYQHYPVFSWPWLRKRSALFAIAICSYATLLALSSWSSAHDLGRALAIAGELVAGAMGLASVGPLLATLVRERRLAPRTERRGVIGALLLGLLLSFAIDELASAAIDAEVAPADTRSPSDVPVGAMALNGVALFTMYGLVGGGLALGRYLREAHLLAELAREEELAQLRAQKQALDTRLGLLQAQIEPHFLFNTLASVRSLISAQPALAVSTLDLLVEYLRATIPRLRDTGVESPLAQQLEICERYLQLMQVRTGRLSYAIEAPSALRARAFPALMLMTLVENAIKHGIEPKPGPGRVSVTAVAQGTRMIVSVSDDGVGLQDGMGSGLGLANVRDQLRTRFGAAASLTLENRAGGGVCARITVPMTEESA